MSKSEHSDEQANGAAYGTNKNEACLTCPPLVFLCAAFVPPHYQKGKEIDEEKICCEYYELRICTEPDDEIMKRLHYLLSILRAAASKARTTSSFFPVRKLIVAPPPVLIWVI